MSRSMSRYILIALSLVFITVQQPVSHAHEVNPVVADITVGQDAVSLTLALNAEVFLAGIDASVVADTNISEKAQKYDELRGLDALALQSAILKESDRLLAMLVLRSGEDRLALKLDNVLTTEIGNLVLPRITQLTLSAELPTGDAPVVVSMAPQIGAYIIRQQADGINEDELYSDYIAAGLESLPIPRLDPVERSWQATFAQYTVSGIAHIIPKGLDHIVFIMGLFFFSPRWRSLLMQVTVFTLAHSVTLVLATLGVVYIPASIVEPLIALSIAWIGIENILKPKIGVGRLTVIFGFGLLHGLGFAFVLGDVGLSGSAFTISLIAFNIGVEIGQLLVLAPLLVMGYFFSHQKTYRNHVEIPVSAMIALVGLYWFAERVLGG